MKIGYFADGPWSHNALEHIVETNGLEIVFIVPRYDTQDPVLKGWARKLGVPFIPVKNVNSAEFLKTMRLYEPDLLVSMSFNQILKKEIIEYAPKGFINCHAGALPFYRGRNPLNWALINGESSFGITVHYIDEGIDTGDIIEQRLYPIKANDTYASLLKLAESECAAVLYSAINKIASNNINVTKQVDIHPVGSYFGIRTFGDEYVDFRWSAERFYNFVRAISDPGPGARFFLEGCEYAIQAAELIPNSLSYISTVGEVIGKSERGIVVKVEDSSVLLTKIEEINKDGTAQHSRIPDFRIGTRLNSKV